MNNLDHKFNLEVSNWIAKGYRIVDKNDNNRTAILEKKPKINHVMHIILSLLTGGVWLIVYLFLVASNNKKSDTVTISTGDYDSNKAINPLKNFY